MIQPGNPAPPFELPIPEGRVVGLQAACSLGPVVVAFFKASCPTCQLTVPYLEKLHQALKDAGVTVLGVSQDDAETTAAFAAAHGLTFRLLLDGEGFPVSRAWAIENVPSIFLVGKDGQVWEAMTGWSRSELNSIAATAARMAGVTPPVLSVETDGAPVWKPG
jgi:peroxiredoxin